MTRTIFMLLGLVAACGCPSLEKAAPPIVLPPALNLTAIEVTSHDGELSGTNTVTDQHEINRFVEFVNSRQDRWKTLAYTFPSGTHTVAVKQGNETVAVFWPSPGHIGGRGDGEGASSNRLRTLTKDDWDELQSILGILPNPATL